MLGLLKPLPIPKEVWSSISMNFTVILVIVDRLSKFGHFIELQHPYTIASVAQAFMDKVYDIHGLPEEIISDRDVILIHHPSHIPYVKKDSSNDAMDRSLTTREAIIQLLKQNLKKAQERMMLQANKHRTEKEFEVRAWVYLKIKHYIQSSMHTSSYNKLDAKYYRPFQMVAKVGKVVYELQLPLDSKIHNVFHVSLLKRQHGNHVVYQQLPSLNEEGQIALELGVILNRRMIRRANKLVAKVLVQWSNSCRDDCTWEDYKALKAKYPHWNSCGQEFSEEGGIDIVRSIHGLGL
ncbi:Ty3/gypsy retrotransposon protein [Quillaja saponaria]|uniref:Ty3/gypsy retrotransposon protein n=1 Tax=Quillaja saponaria TaxID=32244 RepID=A0AAD7VEM9_QUISA|nr:Ty3/gypsy retrotransposon protein [Quillaja saponaria]